MVIGEAIEVMIGMVIGVGGADEVRLSLSAIDRILFLFYNSIMKSKGDIKKEMEELSKELFRHQQLYYIDATPEISDMEYDRLFDRLLDLEEKHPELASANSATRRVGSDLDNSFPEKEHSIPVLSLDKEYSTEGLEKWLAKTVKNAERSLSFVVEEKIDGASIVLYYRDGKLDTALTRGNGLKGNDVTANVRTIRQVPLAIDEKAEFAVRGEIFIDKTEFEVYNKKFDNKYANPRNLASGSMRNIKSSVAAKVPLNIFSYEAFFSPARSNSHVLLLAHLKENGFNINNNIGFFSDDEGLPEEIGSKLPGITTGKISQLADYVKNRVKERESLNYEIDGLVIKVDEIDVRDSLGYTSHHPRWAIAFKFDAPRAQTRVKDIHVQIGRNGRVTPVANLEPVKIAGSTVARATLHNQEYIEMLELGPGDWVSISKRGEIIPAVEEVLEKAEENPSVFKFPETCPHCDSTLEKDGAHHFCKNTRCRERVKRSIIYFAAKNQMDIDTLGEKTIVFLYEKEFIRDIPDLYTFDYDLLLNEEGFKEKKVNNIKTSIQNSKQQPFRKVLTALGLDGLGASAARDLVNNGYNDVEEIIRVAKAGDVEVFAGIEGFGEITAHLLIRHFTDAHNLDVIAQLKESGLNFKEEIVKETVDESQLIFKDQVWVITGSFEHFKPRSKAKEEIEKRGGKTSGSVSSKTTHLLAGEASGSKLQKAQKLGIEIVDEKKFLEMMK